MSRFDQAHRFQPSRAALAATFLAAACMGGSQAEAATITLTNSMGTFGQHWGLTGYWSDNAGAHAGADYLVNGGKTVRSPTEGSNTFAGDSLTIDGAQLNLNSTDGTITTINNLVLTNNGVIVNATVSSTQTLAGSLSVASGDSGIIRTAGQPRHITVSAAVGGGGTLHTLQGGNTRFTNGANTFSGTWSIGGSAGGTTTESTAPTNFIADADGALGNNASVVVNAHGRFNPNFDWTTTGSLTIGTNGLLILDDAGLTLSVGALTIGATVFSPGTYSYATLNSGATEAFIADGGADSAQIVVVPEPMTSALLAMGSAMVLGRRRSAR